MQKQFNVNLTKEEKTFIRNYHRENGNQRIISSRKKMCNFCKQREEGSWMSVVVGLIGVLAAVLLVYLIYVLFRGEEK